MSRTYHEKDFPDMDYEEFYDSHFFQPVSDDDAINAHRIFPRVAWALDIAKETKPRRILDLGCLEGYAALTLAKHCDSVKLAWGVDLSEDGIAMAKSRINLVDATCVFEKDSIENLLEERIKSNERDGSPDGQKFNLIMAFEVMEHVKDPELVFKLIDKVLAPGGTVLISTPAFESPTFGKDDEQNKCHVRLYTLKDEDYEEANKYGNVRKATSLPKQIGKERIISSEVFSELIHLRYT